MGALQPGIKTQNDDSVENSYIVFDEISVDYGHHFPT
jgi:hypothetical protein